MHARAEISLALAPTLQTAQPMGTAEVGGNRREVYVGAIARHSFATREEAERWCDRTALDEPVLIARNRGRYHALRPAPRLTVSEALTLRSEDRSVQVVSIHVPL